MSLPEFLSGDDAAGLSGVFVGVVTDNEDPAGTGRVKLTFPWRGADDESRWARMAVPMAGADRGTYFLPEVGDEVLVAFEHGDVHYPYVLGALWNGKEKPPADNADGTNAVRTIRSRSGHEIILDDSEGGGTVELRTSAGHEIVLDDSEGGERIAITDESGSNAITFDLASGAVELVGSGSVSLRAPTVEIKGDGNVTVEAGGVLTLNGAMVKIN